MTGKELAQGLLRNVGRQIGDKKIGCLGKHRVRFTKGRACVRCLPQGLLDPYFHSGPHKLKGID